MGFQWIKQKKNNYYFFIDKGYFLSGLLVFTQQRKGEALMAKTKYNVVRQEFDDKTGQFIVQKNGGEEEYFGFGGFMGQNYTIKEVMKLLCDREIERTPKNAIKANFVFGELDHKMDSGKQMELKADMD